MRRNKKNRCYIRCNTFFYPFCFFLNFFFSHFSLLIYCIYMRRKKLALILHFCFCVFSFIFFDRPQNFCGPLKTPFSGSSTPFLFFFFANDMRNYVFFKNFSTPSNLTFFQTRFFYVFLYFYRYPFY